jgi:PAS domain-containing protein
MSAISEITWAWEPPQTEFNSFFEQAPVGFAQCRLSGQVIATNPALQAILQLKI